MLIHDISKKNVTANVGKRRAAACMGNNPKAASARKDGRRAQKVRIYRNLRILFQTCYWLVSCIRCILEVGRILRLSCTHSNGECVVV